MPRRLLYISLLVFFVQGITAQESLWSQFYMNKLALNPAFAGVTDGGVINLGLRSQWLGYGASYNTVNITGDAAISRSSAVGGVIYGDRAGDGLLSRTFLKGIYATHVDLSRESTLRGGLEVGLGYSYIDWSKLRFEDGIRSSLAKNDPLLAQYSDEDQISSVSNRYMMLGAGILLSHKNYYVGLSGKYLNLPSVVARPYEGLKALEVHAHGGYTHTIDHRDDHYLVPHLVMSYAYGSFQATPVVIYGYKGFEAGAGTRISARSWDAVIGMFGFRNDFWRVSYSYDLTLSALTVRTLGTHEVGISYFLNPKSNAKFSKYQDCYKIFR